MTHYPSRCLFCHLPFGRRGGRVILRTVGRHLLICRVCAAEQGYVPIVADPEESDKGHA